MRKGKSGSRSVSDVQPEPPPAARVSLPTADVLRAAAALIADEAAWCQGAFARDGNGDPCGVHEPAAVRWSGQGAIRRVMGEPYDYAATAVVMEACTRITARSLVEVNEVKGHVAVLDVLRRAAAGEQA